MNSNPKMSMIGVWTPVDASKLSSNNTGQLLQNLSALLPIGNTGNYGVILAGNAASGGFAGNADTFAQVNIAILLPSQSGLQVATNKVVSDPIINGTQSIVVTDFNNDGSPDIFMSAENEMPFVFKASTAYVSDNGTYKKVTLGDNVINHSAVLVTIDNKPMIVGTSYHYNGINDTVDQSTVTTNPIYTYENGEFKIQNTQRMGGASSGTLGRFGPNGEMYVVRGDAVSGWNGSAWTSQNIVVYPFNGTDVDLSSPVQSIVPYLSTLPEYKTFQPSVGGMGMTHTYQLWSLDLNHDRKMDLLAGETMWSYTNSNYPSALQVLINDGKGKFVDATAKLNPEISLNKEQFDYNPTFVDIDHSGIDTLFFGFLSFSSPERQTNYLLLNDGTGRLHVGLHDEFYNLATTAVNVALSANPGYYTNIQTRFPKFIAVPNSAGEVNYVAVVNAGGFNSQNGFWQDKYFLVDVPLKYNPTIDYKQNVEITDRNNSLLIRTWAGNDTFYDNNANASATSSDPTKINGGLGVDKVVYSGGLGDYALTYTNGIVTVDSKESAPVKVHDRLENIESLKFSNFEIKVSVKATAQSVGSDKVEKIAELYVAFFNRVPDADGIEYWIEQYNNGMSMDTIANSFYQAGLQYSHLTGFSYEMTDSDFVNIIYQNVLGRKDGADSEGLAYWTAQLANHTVTRGTLVSTILESAHSFKGDTGWGWVASLLDNKIAVAKTVAVDWGVSFTTAEINITRGHEIAMAVTPTDTDVALSLVGINPWETLF